MAKFVTIWLFIFNSFQSNCVDIEYIRTLFFKSGIDSKTSNELHSYISKCADSSPVIMAYKGISEAMSARNTNWVYKKYILFVSGRDTLEKAVKKDPFNFEIRFLRFQFQCHIPEFLGYDNKEKDKIFLLTHAQSFYQRAENKDFYKKMILAISNSKFISIQEKESLISIINVK